MAASVAAAGAVIRLPRTTAVRPGPMLAMYTLLLQPDTVLPATIAFALALHTAYELVAPTASQVIVLLITCEMSPARFWPYVWMPSNPGRSSVFPVATRVSPVRLIGYLKSEKVLLRTVSAPRLPACTP